jgi:hypothetical protein
MIIETNKEVLEIHAIPLSLAQLIVKSSVFEMTKEKYSVKCMHFLYGKGERFGMVCKILEF